MNRVVALQGLYAITDPQLMAGEQLYLKAEQALQGGARLLQYRDKHASPAEKQQRARMLNTLCERYDAGLIINDDLQLCLDVNAAGVHLGRGDGDVPEAREALGPERILGVTCHDDLSYALRARDHGVDYCAFGRLFPSQTKPEAPACTLTRISEAKALGLNVVAIGGITVPHAPEVIAAGADMLAVIHDLFSHADVAARARQYSALFS